MKLKSRLAGMTSLILACGALAWSHPLAWAQQPEATAGETATAPPAYTTIAPEDILEISVLGEPELTRKLLVPADGAISYPHAGSIRVVGLTVGELHKILQEKLVKQLVNPQITIAISQRSEQYVSVLGSVKKAGKVAIKEGWRVLEVLAEAGGPDVERLEWANVTLVRKGLPQAINLVRLFAAAAPADNLPVEAGDILLVQKVDPALTQVQVLGEVIKQGSYPVPSDGSLVSAIAAAGGTTPQAALARAVLRRDGKEIALDLRPVLKRTTDSAAGETSPATVQLQGGDILFIPQNTRRFAVLGAVNKGGPLEFPEDRPVDILEALSLAGGPTRDADLKNVVLMQAVEPTAEGTTAAVPPKIRTLDLWSEIRRKNGSGKAASTQSPTLITLNPGDVLWVPDKAGSTRTNIREMLTVLPSFFWLLR